MPGPPIKQRAVRIPRRSAPIRNLEDLEISLPGRIRIILRLEHGILDRVPATPAPQLHLRRLRQAPLDAVDADELRASQVRGEAAQLLEVAERDFQPCRRAEAAGHFRAVRVVRLPGARVQGTHGPVRDGGSFVGLACGVFGRNRFEVGLDRVGGLGYGLGDFGLGDAVRGDGKEYHGSLGWVVNGGLPGAGYQEGSHGRYCHLPDRMFK